MANTTLTADIVLKEAFRVLRNNTYFINTLKPQYDNSYAAYGAKAGSDIRIRVPMEYTVRSGKTLSIQNNVEQSVTLSRSTQTGVDLKFSTAELTQEIESLSEQYITPAMATLAADLEFKALTVAYQGTSNGVVLPVTSLDRADILAAGVQMDRFAVPRDGRRHVVLDPKGQADVVTDLAGLFQDSAKVAAQYRDGTMGQGLGFMFGMSQGVNTMTTGTRASYQVNDTAAEGDAEITVGTGTGTIAKGEIFTFASVNSVNPLTKQSTGQLMQFTVTTAYTATTTNITFSPALYATGPRQNVTALPANTAALTFLGGTSTAFPQNLAYHPNAYAFATVDLDMPPVEFKARRTEDGISMRLVGFYDGNNDDVNYRIDLLHGTVVVQPRFGSRIYGV